MSFPEFFDVAPCRGKGELFHAPHPSRWRGPWSNAVAGRVQQALETCGACSHRDECLEWACVNGERDGIWGGTLPHERTVADPCSLCGTPFFRSHSSERYCGSECREEADRVSKLLSQRRRVRRLAS